MRGTMMDRPLLIADIMKYAADVHSASGVISRTTEGGIHSQSYPQTLERCARLALALRALGVERHHRVATLAWNGYRHLELYYAVSGMGAVCHTVNPRLPAEQLIYIVNHAADKVLFVDITFVPVVEQIMPQLPPGLTVVIMTDRDHMPDTSIAGVLCYEDLLAAQAGGYEWPTLDENTAAGMCYTSGTTGNPKGVMYSHRSTLLHAFSQAVSFVGIFAPGNRILPAVPQFHVNAWGTPYSSPLSGASLVMPGAHLDGASLFELMDEQRVFAGFGVPTIWAGLLSEMERRNQTPDGLKKMVIGGSATPRSMIEGYHKRGVEVVHAWGMTEVSPIGTQLSLGPEYDDTSVEERVSIMCSQGRRIFGVEMKIVDEDGTRLPHDGQASGELFVRGPFVIEGYYRNDEATQDAFDAEGWFGTGDVCTIDKKGFMRVVDRTKDMIKSGGEWISSIDLENAALAHDAVASCAVVAVPHPKWEERPVLVVVPAAGAAGTEELKQSVLALLGETFAKWQLPDDVVFVEALPLTGTGKVSKKDLRATLANHKLP